MATGDERLQQQPLHILFLPFFAPGHLIPVANIATLFSARGDRGFIIQGWAPQVLILNHHAVGGFVTHCGWNSALEAVSAGVPMVTWPRHADQFPNEKLIVEVIGGSIMRLMDSSEESDAIRKKANDLSMKARSVMEEGGSSYNDVGVLIDELMARQSSAVG